MKLIFIGSDFYHKSHSFMSCIYHENGGRCDWGKVELALAAGESVEIRPATRSELDFYNEELAELQKKHGTETLNPK